MPAPTPSPWNLVAQKLAQMGQPGLSQGDNPEATTLDSTALAAKLNPTPEQAAQAQAPRPAPVMGNQLPEGYRKGDQVQGLMEQIKSLNNAGIDDQKAQLADYRKKLEAIQNSPQQINFQPLMALADAWTGSHLAQSYKAPMSPAERAAQAASLQAELLKRQQDLTKDQRDQLKDSLMMQLGVYRASDDKSQALAQRMQMADATHLQAAQKSFIDDTKDLRTQNEASDRVEQILNLAKTNPAALSAKDIAFAKEWAGTRINEPELRTGEGSPALVARAQQWINSAEGKGLTPDNYKLLKQISDVAKQSNATALEKRRNDAADSYAQLMGMSGLAVDPDTAYMKLFGKKRPAQAAPNTPAPASVPPQGQAQSGQAPVDPVEAELIRRGLKK